MDGERSPGRVEDAPRWLDDVEMAAWLGFIETQSDLIAALGRDLAVFGLTIGDYQVLVHLSAADDASMRMCDLASVLQLTPSGLTRRLDGLVGSGWVERRPSDDDRRVMRAVLTPEGKATLDDIAPAHVASVRARMIDLLDRDELTVLARAFSKIRSALDESGDDTVT